MATASDKGAESDRAANKARIDAQRKVEHFRFANLIFSKVLYFYEITYTPLDSYLYNKDGDHYILPIVNSVLALSYCCRPSFKKGYELRKEFFRDDEILFKNYLLMFNMQTQKEPEMFFLMFLVRLAFMIETSIHCLHPAIDFIKHGIYCFRHSYHYGYFDSMGGFHRLFETALRLNEKFHFISPLVEMERPQQRLLVPLIKMIELVDTDNYIGSASVKSDSKFDYLLKLRYYLSRKYEVIRIYNEETITMRFVTVLKKMEPSEQEEQDISASKQECAEGGPVEEPNVELPEPDPNTPEGLFQITYNFFSELFRYRKQMMKAKQQWLKTVHGIEVISNDEKDEILKKYLKEKHNRDLDDVHYFEICDGMFQVCLSGADRLTEKTKLIVVDTLSIAMRKFRRLVPVAVAGQSSEIQGEPENVENPLYTRCTQASECIETNAPAATDLEKSENVPEVIETTSADAETSIVETKQLAKSDVEKYEKIPLDVESMSESTAISSETSFPTEDVGKPGRKSEDTSSDNEILSETTSTASEAPGIMEDVETPEKHPVDNETKSDECEVLIATELSNVQEDDPNNNPS